MKNYIVSAVAVVIIIILGGCTLTSREEAANAKLQVESYKTQNKRLQKEIEELENISSGENIQTNEESPENEEISQEDYMQTLYQDFNIEKLQNKTTNTYQSFVKQYKDFYAYIEDGKISLEVKASEVNSNIENITDVSEKTLSLDTKILDVAFLESEDEMYGVVIFEDGTLGYLNFEALLLGNRVQIEKINDVNNIIFLREIIINNENTTIIAISKEGNFYDIIDLIK